VTVQVAARAGQAARAATLAVRHRAITLRPPNARRTDKLPNGPAWAAWASETTPPAGVQPIAWLRRTTGAIATSADAGERLGGYAARWGSEVWHKVLTSGGRIETRQRETVACRERCLPRYRVIAWRILSATMRARAAPELPCTVRLDEDEWQARSGRINRVSIPPKQPPTLRQAMRWIAQLGGCLGRKRDGEPGVTVLWKGFQHRVDLTAMYRIMRPLPHR
jgi:hypothetical protein